MTVFKSWQLHVVNEGYSNDLGWIREPNITHTAITDAFNKDTVSKQITDDRNKSDKALHRTTGETIFKFKDMIKKDMYSAMI